MQLTGTFALLAAIAYSAPSTFALPIAGNSDLLDARDVQNDMDAREIDDLQFAARELIERYHQARGYFNELDARSLEELEQEAREFDDFLFMRGAGVTHQAIVAELEKITANHALDGPIQTISSEVPKWWSQEIKVKHYASRMSGVTDDSQADDDVSADFNSKRMTRLQTILSKKQDAAFTKAVNDEKTALQHRHQADQRLAPELREVLMSTQPPPVALLLLALMKNDELALLRKIADAKPPSPSEGTAHAKAVLAEKDRHVQQMATDPKDKAKSDKWHHLLGLCKAATENGTPDPLIVAEVKKTKERVKNLRILADSKQSPAARNAALAADKQSRASDAGGTASATPAVPPPTVPATKQPATQKLSRRRFNY